MMNKWNYIALLCAVLPLTPAAAQVNRPVLAANAAMVTRRMDVCTQKTSNIIFPAPVSSVDRGNADILVQKPDGVANVLKIKAAKPHFQETNLTVITDDGQFYSFTVDYNPNPQQLVWEPLSLRSGAVGSDRPAAIFSDAANNQSLIRRLEASAAATRRNIRNVQDKTAEMKATVRGLYTANDMFFIKIILDNRSNIDYSIESVKLFIEDKKKIKRTSSQELPVDVVSMSGDSRLIPAHKTGMIIMTVAKQTLAADKQLLLEVIEKNGGRNMVCTLNSKKLLKALPIAAAHLN